MLFDIDFTIEFVSFIREESEVFCSSDRSNVIVSIKSELQRYDFWTAFNLSCTEILFSFKRSPSLNKDIFDNPAGGLNLWSAGANDIRLLMLDSTLSFEEISVDFLFTEVVSIFRSVSTFAALASSRFSVTFVTLFLILEFFCACSTVFFLSVSAPETLVVPDTGE